MGLPITTSLGDITALGGDTFATKDEIELHDNDLTRAWNVVEETICERAREWRVPMPRFKATVSVPVT